MVECRRALVQSSPSLRAFLSRLCASNASVASPDARVCLLLRHVSVSGPTSPTLPSGSSAGSLYLAYHWESGAQYALAVRALRAAPLVGHLESLQALTGDVLDLPQGHEAAVGGDAGVTDGDAVPALLFPARELKAVDAAPKPSSVKKRSKIGSEVGMASSGNGGGSSHNRKHHRSKRSGDVDGEAGQARKRRTGGGDGPGASSLPATDDGGEIDGMDVAPIVVDVAPYRALLSTNYSLTCDRKTLDDTRQLLQSLTQSGTMRKQVRVPAELSRVYREAPRSGINCNGNGTDGSHRDVDAGGAYPSSWRHLAACFQAMPPQDLGRHCTHGVQYAGAQIRVCACFRMSVPLGLGLGLCLCLLSARARKLQGGRTALTSRLAFAEQQLGAVCWVFLSVRSGACLKVH